jgi:hypothetical protein
MHGSLIVCVISISLEIGEAFVRLSATMKLSHRLAAFGLVALLLPASHAFAQSSSGDEFEQDDSKPKPKSEEAAPAVAPAEAATTAKPLPPAPPPAAQPVSDNPYVPFAPPPAPLRIENENVSIQIGLLAQPQLEVAGGPDATLTSKNLFLRRIRFMVGGTLYKYFEFFFDTDYPNLFKNDAATTPDGTYKNSPGLNVQDAYITFKPLGELVKLDAGFMLPPGPHNGLESAAKLYATDYFVNTFRRSILNDNDPLGGSAAESPQGRDAGVQLRFLLAGGHVEARAGVFQGVRNNPIPASPGVTAEVGDYNIFRFAGRVQVNVLDAEPGFFYQGTYLGTKKILSFGGFYDYQYQQTGATNATYKYYGGDAILDLPVGPGILTAQADITLYNDELGAAVTMMPTPTTTITVAPTNRAYMAQAGYLIAPIMLNPFVQYEHLYAPNAVDSMGNDIGPNPLNPSENRYGGGVSFWPYGHNMNLKLLAAHVTRNPAPHAFNQFNLQWQLYFY